MAKREPEYCDDCGEVVGYYDPTRPEGDKIVLTHLCGCWTKSGKREPRPAKPRLP